MKKLAAFLLLILCLAAIAGALAEGGNFWVTVYRDSNENGEKGTYERPVPDVAIALLDANGAAAAEGKTNREGELTLSGVPAGTYTLSVSMPGNYGFSAKGSAGRASSSVTVQSDSGTQQVPGIEIRDGETTSAGIAAALLCSVSGQAWQDMDGDGLRSSGEPGMPGVIVRLYNKNNPDFYYEVSTDERGEYSLSHVRPAVYRLRVTIPEGYMFTKYRKSGGQNRSIITTEGKLVGAVTLALEAGDNENDKNIGVVMEGAIAGICYLDANYNGIYDAGEAPLPGVKLELARQKNGDEIASTTSGADGRYIFHALRDSSYRVTAILPEGYDFTATVTGGNQFASRPGRRSNTVQNVAVEVNRATDVSVGAVKYGSVSGVAFLDDNFSGSRDGKENVVSGMVVRLLNEKGEIIAKDRTNGKGRFQFEDVAPGSYYLTATAKTGYAFTKAGNGSVMLNDAQGEGHSPVFAVGIGESRTDLNLGMIKPGTVKGTFFADRNDNGLMDSGEGGLTGTRVSLMSDDGAEFTAVIGESGGYVFDAVMPGVYWLRYELPEHAVMARVAAGGNTLAGTEGERFQFTVGSTREAPLAGGLTLGEISGTVFEDPDADGRMTGSEIPQAGTVLTLTPARGELQALTVTTDTTGAFRFPDLRPDDWTLTVACPAGKVLSRTAGTGLPLNPGENRQDAALTLAMGDRYIGQELGTVQPASLQGQVWLDENLDGVLDAMEARPEGVEIRLVDETSGRLFATLKTDSEGFFQSSGLVPGAYTLSYTPTAGIRGASQGSSTFSAEGGELRMSGLVLRAGETQTAPRLGLVRENVISGRVWVDRGGDIQSLAGAELILTTPDGKERQTSDDNGNYAFKGLLPGAYTLQIRLPEGQLVAEPTDERLTKGLVSVMTKTSGRTGSVSIPQLSMTGDYTHWDIGGVLPGRLGDKAWLDENGNGLQDTDEQGLAGVVIELTRNGQVLETATTDQYGYWVMKDVYPAAYILRVTPPAEVKPTRRNTQVPIMNSVLEETEETVAVSVPVTVESEEKNYDADLGFVLRKQGVYPAGFGKYDTQNWVRIETYKE